MELRELGDRLFRLHAKLIIAIFLVGVLGGLAIHVRDKPQYQASVQFVLGAADPQNASEAAVLADTAHGIATGVQLVSGAISELGINRNPVTVAANTNVQTIGSSGVLTLSVTDPDPQVAVRLANTLAADVVSTRITLTQNGLASSLRSLALQETAIDVQIQKLTSQIGQLVGRPSSSTEVKALRTRVTGLQNQAGQIAVQRNDLQAQAGPRATVIDKALSAVGVPGRTVLDVLLGGLLGLVVGIAIAGARETVRPSLVGAPSISRAIGAPLLGEMNTPPDEWTVANLPDAGSYVELAADAQHVKYVRFAALEAPGRRRARVRMLEGPLHRLRVRQPSQPRVSANTTPISLYADEPDRAGPAARLPDLDAKDSPRTGLVVAIPRILKLADVDALTNFIWISGWTLLGVIVYPPSKKPATTTPDPPQPTGSQPESPLSGQVGVDA
jgi:capsular polysaccharide biosynthesis protein